MLFAKVHPGWSAVPEYRHTILYNCMIFLTVGFGSVFPEKRLELKSPMGQTTAEEEGSVPISSAFVWPIGLFSSSRFSGKTEPKPTVKNIIQF
jgi:hypothetical protein